MKAADSNATASQSTRKTLSRVTSDQQELRRKSRAGRSPKYFITPRQRQLKPSEIKRPLLEAERFRLRTAIHQSCTPFVYELNSTELDLTRGYAYICTELDLHDTFFAIVPCRIGSDKAIDSAANALIHLFAGVRGDRKSEFLCTQKYAHAITMVRRSMHSETWQQSDAALLAIFLLAFYEHKLREEQRAFSELHRKGMCAVLIRQASVRLGHETELVRSLLYQAWNLSFRSPCIQGISSPFDIPQLLGMEPPLQLKLPAELTRLRKISNQLLIRLPGLIAAIRKLRQESIDQRMDLTEEVVATALELLALRDKDGENAVLHRVKIIHTASESPLSKSSFHFEQPSEFKTTAYYWGARILICRITIALMRLGILSESETCTEALLRLENETSATNMTMTWDYGQAHGAILGRTVLVPGYTFVWGVLLDHDTFRGLPSTQVKAWLLTNIHSFETGMSVHVTEKELDDAAEAFVGGPIAGLEHPALDSFFGI